jgi:prophage regulatory protein
VFHWTILNDGVQMPPTNPFPKAPVLPDVGFVRLPQILSVLPIGKSSWWAGIRAGRYPAPIKLGPRTSVWRVEDIKALLAALGGNGLA